MNIEQCFIRETAQCVEIVGTSNQSYKCINRRAYSRWQYIIKYGPVYANTVFECAVILNNHSPKAFVERLAWVNEPPDRITPGRISNEQCFREFIVTRLKN